MSAIRERPLTAEAPAPSSRWAWSALLASVVLYPIAVVVELGNQESELGPTLISAALVFLPPVCGIVLGVRSGRGGNRRGGLATAIGSAWLTLIVMFFVGANFVWIGERLVAPGVLAVVLAVVVGGAVERAWHSYWARPHTSD